MDHDKVTLWEHQVVCAVYRQRMPPLDVAASETTGQGWNDNGSARAAAATTLAWGVRPRPHCLPEVHRWPRLILLPLVRLQRFSLIQCVVSSGQPPQVAGNGSNIRTDETEAIRFKACLAKRVRLDPRAEQE
jgi:hypothetical protein